MLILQSGIFEIKLPGRRVCWCGKLLSSDNKQLFLLFSNPVLNRYFYVEMVPMEELQITKAEYTNKQMSNAEILNTISWLDSINIFVRNCDIEKLRDILAEFGLTDEELLNLIKNLKSVVTDSYAKRNNMLNSIAKVNIDEVYKKLRKIGVIL